MRNFIKIILILIFFPSVASAARPLSTDDAGTVEKGHFEFESGFEYVNTQDDEYNWTQVIKSGISDNWDIGIEVPYQCIEVSGGDDVNGLSDIVICSKYRFLDETETSPAISFSYSIKTETGDEDKALGTGAVDHTINAILSKELDKIITHLNLGYTCEGTPEGESHNDVLSYSGAIEFPVNDRLNLVGELTGETNFEGDFDDSPFSGLLGLNYGFLEDVTFDLGFGWGISNASSDYTVTSGLTLSF